MLRMPRDALSCSITLQATRKAFQEVTKSSSYRDLQSNMINHVCYPGMRIVLMLFLLLIKSEACFM